MDIIQQYLLSLPSKEFVNFGYAVDHLNDHIRRFGIEAQHCAEISRGNKRQLIQLGSRRIQIALPVVNLQTQSQVPDWYIMMLAIFKPHETLEYSSWMISFTYHAGTPTFFVPKIY
jgi:hypothetical protein